MTDADCLKYHIYMWDKIIEEIRNSDKIVDVVKIKKRITHELHIPCPNDCFLCRHSVNNKSVLAHCDCMECIFNIKNETQLINRVPERCCGGMWYKVVSPTSRKSQLKYAIAIRNLRYTI